MRDRHDKRLRFYIVIVRLFFLIFAVVLIFVTFWLKMAVFCTSQKYPFDNRNFENSKFPNILTLLCSNFQPLRPLLHFLCCIGRLRCALLHTPRTFPINVLIDRITPGYRQVMFQFSIIKLTNRIRKRKLTTPPQLITCHKWHHTRSHCLSKFSQNLRHEECPR